MKIDGPCLSSAPLVAQCLTQRDLCGPDDRRTAAIVERQPNGFDSRGVRQLAQESLVSSDKRRQLFVLLPFSGLAIQMGATIFLGKRPPPRWRFVGAHLERDGPRE